MTTLIIDTMVITLVSKGLVAALRVPRAYCVYIYIYVHASEQGIYTCIYRNKGYTHVCPGTRDVYIIIIIISSSSSSGSSSRRRRRRRRRSSSSSSISRLYWGCDMYNSLASLQRRASPGPPLDSNNNDTNHVNIQYVIIYNNVNVQYVNIQYEYHNVIKNRNNYNSSSSSSSSNDNDTNNNLVLLLIILYTHYYQYIH